MSDYSDESVDYSEEEVSEEEESGEESPMPVRGDATEGVTLESSELKESSKIEVNVEHPLACFLLHSHNALRRALSELNSAAIKVTGRTPVPALESMHRKLNNVLRFDAVHSRQEEDSVFQAVEKQMGRKANVNMIRVEHARDEQMIHHVLTVVEEQQARVKNHVPPSTKSYSDESSEEGELHVDHPDFHWNRVSITVRRFVILELDHLWKEERMMGRTLASMKESVQHKYLEKTLTVEAKEFDSFAFDYTIQRLSEQKRADFVEVVTNALPKKRAKKLQKAADRLAKAEAAREAAKEKAKKKSKK